MCICVIKLKRYFITTGTPHACGRILIEWRASGDACCHRPPPTPCLCVCVGSPSSCRGARPYCATLQKSKPNIKGDALMMSLHLAVIHRPLTQPSERRALNHPLRRRNYIAPCARSRRPKRETKRLPTDEKTPLFILGEQRAFSFFLLSAQPARGGPIKFLRFVSRWSALTAQLEEHCLAWPLAWLPMGKTCFWAK